jgi:hypothetical protein
MRLRQLGATIAPVAILATLFGSGCGKPPPPTRSIQDLHADEIRGLEKLRIEETARYKAEGKSAEQIEAMKAGIQRQIEAIKNPPPPPDDLPPPEPPEKKG